MTDYFRLSLSLTTLVASVILNNQSKIIYTRNQANFSFMYKVKSHLNIL